MELLNSGPTGLVPACCKLRPQTPQSQDNMIQSTVFTKGTKWGLWGRGALHPEPRFLATPPSHHQGRAVSTKGGWVPHLWGKYQAGGQAGNQESRPGHAQTRCCPRRTSYSSKTSFLEGLRLGREGLPSRGFFLALIPSSLFFPTTIHIVLPPEEGVSKPHGREGFSSPSAARQALSPNRANGREGWAG